MSKTEVTDTGLTIRLAWTAIDQGVSYVALCMAVVLLAMDGQLLTTVFKAIVSVMVIALLWKRH